MNITDLPSTLHLSNPGSLTVGIANIQIPAGGSRTVNLALMGPAPRCDLWQAAHAARLAGLVATAPLTEALEGSWQSTHSHQHQHSGSADGHGDGGRQFSPAPRATTGFRILPAGLRVDFRAVGNARYVPILTQL